MNILVKVANIQVALKKRFNKSFSLNQLHFPVCGISADYKKA